MQLIAPCNHNVGLSAECGYGAKEMNLRGGNCEDEIKSAGSSAAA